MSDFSFQPLLPTQKEQIPYRLITQDYVSEFKAGKETFLKIEPQGLTLLTQEAMRDIAHLLRPGHLTQLQNILTDPEASDNDRFVTLELLKNANIAAGFVLPSCQDTGTAIIMGKKGQTYSQALMMRRRLLEGYLKLIRPQIFDTLNLLL